MTKLTYRFRLRDTADSELTRQSRAVNLVWNYCNEVQKQAVHRHRKWHTGYDLQKLTAGSSKELNLHAHTIQQVCERYARSREAGKKPWLKWRVSNQESPQRSLGWVPFNTGHVTYRDGGFVFRGRVYRAWISRDLEEGQVFGSGSFSQDAQGHWFINLAAEVDDRECGSAAIGIDLGLKDLAALSTGEKIPHPGHYRRSAERLGIAQRAGKKRQARKLNAKIKAQRGDHLHKLSTRLVRENGAIFVGNVNASSLAKTRMGKSVLDAGWSMLKTQIEYKAIRHRAVFMEVNEAFSTQACSQCGSIEGPKGVAGLRIREWVCSCGASHDRDTNAAMNILRVGLDALAAGASNG